VSVEAAQGLAQAVWSRAASDSEFVAASAGDLLLVIRDSEQHERVWIEHLNSAGGASAGAAGGSGLNVRKRLSARVASSGATSAAIACWATYRINWRAFHWLLALALDDTDDFGYLADASHDGRSFRVRGPRRPWPSHVPTPFEEPDVLRALDPARAALANTLRNGLHDAAKRQRRQARR
jgi:hypothetical protein